MSADLDSRPSLPKIQVGISLRKTPRACSDGGKDDIAVLNDNSYRNNPVEKEIVNSSDEECQTPKSAEFKIPAILRCPSAPRKLKSAPISCKRKQVSELPFFDVVNRVEVESFFRSGFQMAKRISTPISSPCNFLKEKQSIDRRPRRTVSYRWSSINSLSVTEQSTSGIVSRQGSMANQINLPDGGDGSMFGSMRQEF
ncbi:unnamed protein product [Linum tenue]|uniref:Uncharacterized protein n=1 Tax=Linum tenue TaxID=586396 RepID=A0AAV0KZP3_9ROSI|nr:unnamed protein product [Linum tenue]